jgi:type II secretory ATPase GspE/PulE/Tfp pilus assembly ATPase PilB-like protein
MESAVSAVLEHDPDIIVIEDVNDGRPLSIAARAAMRGKLVLCGIPRCDTEEVLEYLMGFRQNGVLLSQIRGVLVFRAGVIPCPICMQASDAVQQADSVQGSRDLPGFNSVRGCPACGYTGFSGHKFLVDVIPFTGETAIVLSSADAAEDILKYVEGKGYNGMVREWNELLKSGGIVPAEFVAYGE